MKGSGAPKKHHYVPVSYLSRFAAEDKYLAVYDRVANTFRRQLPREVMHINNYYHQEWAPAGVDPNLMEKALGEKPETEAKVAIDKLVGTPQLIDEGDVASLVTYIDLQRSRVPRQASSGVDAMKDLIEHMLPEALKAHLASEGLTVTMKDSARFMYMKLALGVHAKWFAQMNWQVIQAAPGEAFVTTDNPVSFFNPACPTWSDPGLGLAGTVVFFPLSSSHALLMKHPELESMPDGSELIPIERQPPRDRPVPLRLGTVWPATTVTSFNRYMIGHSHRLVVARDRRLIESCITSMA